MLLLVVKRPCEHKLHGFRSSKDVGTLVRSGTTFSQSSERELIIELLLVVERPSDAVSSKSTSVIWPSVMGTLKCLIGQIRNGNTTAHACETPIKRTQNARLRALVAHGVVLLMVSAQVALPPSK